MNDNCDDGDVGTDDYDDDINDDDDGDDDDDDVRTDQLLGELHQMAAANGPGHISHLPTSFMVTMMMTMIEINDVIIVMIIMTIPVASCMVSHDHHLCYRLCW